MSTLLRSANEMSALAAYSAMSISSPDVCLRSKLPAMALRRGHDSRPAARVTPCASGRRVAGVHGLGEGGLESNSDVDANDYRSYRRFTCVHSTRLP